MKIADFGFSDDGDLVLGPPQVDSNGDVLYRDEDGSISTKQTSTNHQIRDLSETRNENTMKRIIMNRLKTDNPDWYHHKHIGGNLSDLIGEKNTRETGELGIEYITNALTYNGLLAMNEFNIRAIPTSQDEILFLISIRMIGSEPFRIPLVFDLRRGLKEVR